MDFLYTRLHARIVMHTHIFSVGTGGGGGGAGVPELCFLSINCREVNVWMTTTLLQWADKRQLSKSYQ